MGREIDYKKEKFSNTISFVLLKSKSKTYKSLMILLNIV